LSHIVHSDAAKFQAELAELRKDLKNCQQQNAVLWDRLRALQAQVRVCRHCRNVMLPVTEVRILDWETDVSHGITKTKYEECRLVACDALWVLLELTF
jgi:hypothetical protein